MIPVDLRLLLIKIRLSHLIYRMWCLHCCGGRKRCLWWRCGLWLLISLSLNLYPAQVVKQLKLGLSVDADRQRSACLCFPTELQHVLYTGRLSSERRKCFCITQPISALIFIADENAGDKLWFLQSFLAFNPANDLQSALIHTVWSLDNILAKLLITAVQSPKGFKLCIKQCSNICYMWFLLSGMFVYGQLCVFLCALEG